MTYKYHNHYNLKKIEKTDVHIELTMQIVLFDNSIISVWNHAFYSFCFILLNLWKQILPKNIF